MRYEIYEVNDGFEVRGYVSGGSLNRGCKFRSGFFNRSEGWTRAMVENAVRHLITNTVIPVN